MHSGHRIPAIGRYLSKKTQIDLSVTLDHQLINNKNNRGNSYTRKYNNETFEDFILERSCIFKFNHSLGKLFDNQFTQIVDNTSNNEQEQSNSD